MKKVILKISGMSCSGCSSSLEKYLNKQDGVNYASVNLVLAEALIEYDDKLQISDLERFVKEAGFESLGEYNEKEDNKNDKGKLGLIIFGILSFLTLYICMSHMLNLPVIKYIDINRYPVNYSLCLFLLATIFLIFGKDIIIKGIKNLIHKSPSMDTLVTLGVITSYLYSVYNFILVLFGNNTYVENLYFESCVIVIFFIKIGRYIDLKSKEKTKQAIKELVQITPKTALLKVDGKENKVTIDEIKKDDILIAKPGMKIAVDGIITKGKTHIDESFITGESTLNKKTTNDTVVAGSINVDGYIEYKAQKIGKDSTISEIVRLVVESSNTKAPISRITDTVCSYFVPIVIIISILTFVIYMILGYEFKESMISFVNVLVVSCPCALGLAPALAIVISEGLCAKNGILVKNSETLENASKIDTIIFDKTGTLTYGNLKISKIFNYSKYSNDELIKIISSIEINSNHPIKNAFNQYINDNKIEKVSEFEEISGIGLKAKINNKEIYIGNNKLFNKLNIKNKYESDENVLISEENSIIYVIENKKVIGLIGVKDIIRDNVKKTISKLYKLNKEIIMLTGDNEKTANMVAKELGIKQVIANVLPKEKSQVIKDLINNKKKVMMVGDGINDAPALALATTSVSINNATDIAADSSDVILTNNNLEKIYTLILISKSTIKNIKQNLFWAFFYNICMIPIAIGILKPFSIYLNPMIASFAMTISSLTVVFNSLRLKNFKEK